MIGDAVVIPHRIDSARTVQRLEQLPRFGGSELFAHLRESGSGGECKDQEKSCAEVHSACPVHGKGMRRSIELLACFPPRGVVPVHQGNETRSVIGHEEVNQFMDEHILEHDGGLRGEFGIQPDLFSSAIAGTPPRRHV